ncbi:hypothetical protein DTO169E5_4075 [Paecilomyces variotii]|nr:hypothetical protein DTO169E5_4075 [Paecilomyces variotii]KAJ9408613.1 hypothetical protein DTO045G8_3561 [Paecilomyces variotii]
MRDTIPVPPYRIPWLDAGIRTMKNSQGIPELDVVLALGFRQKRGEDSPRTVETVRYQSKIALLVSRPLGFRSRIRIGLLQTSPNIDTALWQQSPPLSIVPYCAINTGFSFIRPKESTADKTAVCVAYLLRPISLVFTCFASFTSRTHHLLPAKPIVIPTSTISRFLWKDKNALSKTNIIKMAALSIVSESIIDTVTIAPEQLGEMAGGCDTYIEDDDDSHQDPPSPKPCPPNPPPSPA